MNKQTLEITDLVKVESSNIDMVGYSGDTTYVQFKNGSIYSYPKTSREEFEELAQADSVGSHFSRTYRGKQDYAKLENAVLKKSKLNQEQLEDKIIATLRQFATDNMQDATTGVQRMYAKDLIILVRDNSEKAE